MSLTKAGLVQPTGMTTVERNLLSLAGVDSGRLIYNETTQKLQQWDGAKWVDLLNTDSSLAGSKLTGVVSGALIDSLDGTKLTTGVAASLLTGDVDGGTY